MLRPLELVVSACGLFLAACNPTTPAPAAAGDDASDAAPTYPPSAPEGPCAAVVQQFTPGGRVHVPECSYVDYPTKPPNSGNHYPVWSAYRSYSSPIPEGYWVHNLEHGSIVLSYNCAVARDGGAAGCEADVASAQQMLDALPVDPLCLDAGAGVLRRTVMTPDPNLDVPFAASAWGWTLRASCFDAIAFGAFAMAHYGQGPEVLCGNGEDLSVGVPANCGAAPP